MRHGFAVLPMKEILTVQLEIRVREEQLLIRQRRGQLCWGRPGLAWWACWRDWQAARRKASSHLVRRDATWWCRRDSAWDVVALHNAATACCHGRCNEGVMKGVMGRDVGCHGEASRRQTAVLARHGLRRANKLDKQSASDPFLRGIAHTIITYVV